MVDSIGAKPLAISERRIGMVQRVAATTTIAPRDPVPPQMAATELASRPPVDADRVATIRAAITNGTFPLSPATIADRLIALKLEWKSNDPA